MVQISPKYQMKIIDDIEKTLWELFSTSKYRNVLFYIEKWHQSEYVSFNDYWENFTIYRDKNENIDLAKTLHSIDGETLIKIAIDLGVDTPDFIPSIPTFRNEIKSDYPTASATFEKAYKLIETDPDTAIGLANSALESIIKEILNDTRITIKCKKGDTLYKLTSAILNEFKLFPNGQMPDEIKTMGSSLLSVCQSIEGIRSTKTNFHGKTSDDYVVDNPLYTYFVINNVCSIGLFLKSFYKVKYPKAETALQQNNTFNTDDLPF